MTTGFQQWKRTFIDDHGMEPSAADAWNATKPPQDERGQGLSDDALLAREMDERMEHSQPVALSTLTDERIEAAAKQLAACMDYPWEHMPAEGRNRMRLNARAILAASAPAQQGGQGWKLVPETPTTAMVSAMACSKARDAEGEFPALMDLIDYSGENKTHTVLKAAYQSMLEAAPAHDPSTPPQPVAAEVEKDAQRYRFLRMDAGIRNERPFIAVSSAGSISQWTGVHADKQVDAAMAGTGSDESAKENGNG